VVYLRERPLKHHHREHARVDADVALPWRDAARRDHTGARVALRRAEHRTRTQGAGGVEERALRGQHARIEAGLDRSRQQLAQRKRPPRRQRAEPRQQRLVVVARAGSIKNIPKAFPTPSTSLPVSWPWYVRRGS
jgi:hypothetical protein